MTGCVQWNLVYGRKDFHLKRARTRKCLTSRPPLTILSFWKLLNSIQRILHECIPQVGKWDLYLIFMLSTDWLFINEVSNGIKYCLCFFLYTRPDQVTSNL